MTALNLIAAPPLTLAEYAALPKQPRCELVKGELVEQMAASGEHEETAALVILRVGNYVLPNRLGKVYGSNRGYVTGPHSPATARMPDVSFVSNARLGRVVIFTVILAPPTVIPAKAGIYACRLHYGSRRLQRWIPAFAGITVNMTTRPKPPQKRRRSPIAKCAPNPPRPYLRPFQPRNLPGPGRPPITPRRRARHPTR